MAVALGTVASCSCDCSERLRLLEAKHSLLSPAIFIAVTCSIFGVVPMQGAMHGAFAFAKQKHYLSVIVFVFTNQLYCTLSFGLRRTPVTCFQPLRLCFGRRTVVCILSPHSAIHVAVESIARFRRRVFELCFDRCTLPVFVCIVVCILQPHSAICAALDSIVRFRRRVVGFADAALIALISLLVRGIYVHRYSAVVRRSAA